MNIAELAILLKVKTSGAEKLRQADADLKQAAKSAKGLGEGLFIAGTGTESLPPKLDKIAISVARANAAEKASSETKEKAAKKSAESTKGANAQLKEMESWATRSALKLDLLAGSLLYVVDVALRGAMALERFTLATGISPRVLRQEQAAGVRGGIRPDEMAQFVTSLQSQAVQMRMTGQGAPQWGLLSQILGVPLFPGEDPRKLMQDLHSGLMRLRGDQIPFAREIAAQAGISENIFQGLRNPEFSAAGFGRMYDVTQRNLGSMNKLNAEWATLRFSVSTTGEAFVSELVPAMEGAVRFLTRIVGLFSAFVGWLDKGSLAATGLKILIGALGLAVGVAAVGLTGFAAALTYAAIAAASLSMNLGPVLATMLSISGAVGGIVAAVAALALIQEDLRVGASGGKSVISKPVARFITETPGTPDWLDDPKAAASDALKTSKDFLKYMYHRMTPEGLAEYETSRVRRGTPEGLADIFRSPVGSSSSAMTTVHQTVTIPVTAAAGREGLAAATIKDALAGLLNQASYGAPAPNR